MYIIIYIYNLYFIRFMAWLQNGTLEAVRVCWARVRGTRRDSDTSSSSGRQGRQVSRHTYMGSHTSMGSFHSPACLPSPLGWDPLAQLYSSRMPTAHPQVSSTMAGSPDMDTHT